MGVGHKRNFSNGRSVNFAHVICERGDGQTGAGLVIVQTGVGRQRSTGNNGRGTVHESNTERSLTSFDKRHPQKAFPCLFVPGRVAKQPQRGTNCKG